MSDVGKCTFCTRERSEVLALVAGPSIFVCESCVLHAIATSTRPATGVPHPEQAPQDCYCSFCGKQPKDVSCIAVHGKHGICNECTAVCVEVLLEQQGRGRVVALPPWTNQADRLDPA